VHRRWEETREGATVGGARLTIETGAEFPIGITTRLAVYAAAMERAVEGVARASRSVEGRCPALFAGS